MPRKKRVARKKADTPAPARVTRASAVPVIKAICALCGHAIPEKRAIKLGYTTVDTVDFFASIEWDKDKPFGVRFFATGKAGFKEWEYISPEEAPELFKGMQKRFIQAIKEWQEKGWLPKDLTRDEPEKVKSLLKKQS